MHRCRSWPLSGLLAGLRVPGVVTGWVLAGVCVYADDQPEPEAKGEPECHTGAEHAERGERRQGLPEDLRGVVRAAGGVVGDQQAGEGASAAGKQDSQEDQR